MRTWLTAFMVLALSLGLFIQVKELPADQKETTKCSPQVFVEWCQKWCNHLDLTFAGEIKIDVNQKMLSCLCMPFDDAMKYRRERGGELHVEDDNQTRDGSAEFDPIYGRVRVDL